MAQGEMIAARCPRCGSSLLSDGLTEWCSYVGGYDGHTKSPACAYGIDRTAPLNPLVRAAAEAGRKAYWSFRHQDLVLTPWADADPTSRKQWTFIAAEILNVARRHGDPHA